MNTLSSKKSFFATLTFIIFVSFSLSVPLRTYAIDTGAGFDIEASLSGMNPLEDLAGIALTCAASQTIADTVVPTVSTVTGAIANLFSPEGAAFAGGATNYAAVTETLAIDAARGVVAGGVAGSAVGVALSVPTSNLPLQAIELAKLELAAESAAAKLPKEKQGTMTDGVMDCIVYNAGQKMLEQLTNNTVAWIQGGFHGSPSFSVNTHEVFLELADMVAGDLARELRGIATCDFRVNYKNDLANAVELSTKRQYKFNGRAECPFPETFQLNSSDFYNGINKWSWEGLEYAMQENGNPFGVALLTGNELALRSSEKEDVRKQELSWANGFTNIVDTENCNYRLSIVRSITGGDGTNISQADWDTAIAEGRITTADAREYQKTYCKTTTPGKILGDKLTESTGVDMQRLGLIDSINKIIGAVISQVTKQASIGIFNAVSEENAVLETSYVTANSKTSETIAMENAAIKPYYDAWQAEIKRESDARLELARLQTQVGATTDPNVIASLNAKMDEQQAIIALAPERIATAKAAYDQVSSVEMAILRQQELVAAQQEVDYAKEDVRDAEYDYTVAQAEYYKALATEIDVIIINDLKQNMLEAEAILTRAQAILQAANDRLYAAKHPAYSTSPAPLQI